MLAIIHDVGFTDVDIHANRLQQKNPLVCGLLCDGRERKTGLEPATYSLEGCRSAK